MQFSMLFFGVFLTSLVYGIIKKLPNVHKGIHNVQHIFYMCISEHGIF